MALRDVRTGEMVDVNRDWLEKRSIIESHPLTAPFVAVIETNQQELTESLSRTSTALTDAERKKIEELLAGLDSRWDDSVRVLVSGFDFLARAFPEKAAQYQRAASMIVPDGAAIVNTSLRNEAGESERIAQRVDAHPEVKAVLEETVINGVKLAFWYETLVDTGREIGPLASKLEVSPDRRKDVVREFRARQKWTSLVSTFRRNCELAGWSEADMAAIFGQVDELSAAREKPKKP